jgi:hypothetical protein
LNLPPCWRLAEILWDSSSGVLQGTILMLSLTLNPNRDLQPNGTLKKHGQSYGALITDSKFIGLPIDQISLQTRDRREHFQCFTMQSRGSDLCFQHIFYEI